MPKPPKFDIKKLNDQSQFLCRKGEKLTVPRLDLNNRLMNTSLVSYYCTSVTNVPVEVLNTGNVDVILTYIGEHSNELTEIERQHLNERVDVMLHLADVEKYYQENPRTSVGKMVNQNGIKVLPGIVLDRKQDTGNGCWSCAFSMLLKGRGVELDQKVIRRYRPEFVRGHEIISPEQTDIINSNMMSEIYQYSSLIDKVCPNTKMCKMDRTGQTGATADEMKTQVLKALREKNAPVAFCNGYHWTTIVGVSDDNSTFYVVDSQNTTKGQIDTVNVNDYLDNEKAEFVWLEDIVLEKNGQSDSLPSDRFRVDPTSGSVQIALQGNAATGDSGMSIHGNHVVDYERHMEYYTPTMIRNYSRRYEEQKQQSDLFFANLGTNVDPVPVNKPFTSVHNNDREHVKSYLQRQAETNAVTSRKAYMRNIGLFTQDQIDNMTVEQTNRSYTYHLAHPEVSPIPQDIFSGQSPEARDDFSRFDWSQIPERQNAPQIKDWMQELGLQGENAELDKSLLEDIYREQNNYREQKKEKFTQHKQNDFVNRGDFGTPINDKDFDALSPQDLENLFQEDFSPDLKSKPVKIEDFGTPINDKDFDALSPQELEELFQENQRPDTKNKPFEKEKITELSEKKPETRTAPEKMPVPPKKQEKNPVSVKKNPEEDLQLETMTFALLGQKLEKAKTTVNSKQYNNLVKTIKLLGDWNTVKGFGSELRTAFMAAAVTTIKDYIAHKAKDGVKANVFRKLAAVEETGKYLSACLAPVQGKKIVIDQAEITVDTGVLSLTNQYNAAPRNARECFDKVMLSQTPVEDAISAIRDERLRRTAGNANECMNKILLHAAVSSRQNLLELNAMRIKFADEKFIRNELGAGKEIKTEAKKSGGIHK